MQVPVLEQDRTCGKLWAEQRGLYTVFQAEVETEGVSRLYAVFEEGEAALGIPAPEQGRMVLRISVPTSRLPKGKLLRGCLRPKDQSWRRFPGGRVGSVTLPPGSVLGQQYRFPWQPGEQLPSEELMCFFRFIRKEGRGFLELTLEDGRPVV